MQQRTLIVWDPLVRIFHWSLVLSFVIAWLSPDDWMDAHHWAGYSASALVLFRVVWGFIGSYYARFRQFIKPGKQTLNYLTSMALRKEVRYVGHNPAGSLMIIALIAVVSVTALTGWMYTLDTFWGVSWVEEAHEAFSHLMLFMVIAHVFGVIYASFRHGENLPRSMFDGRKRLAEADDIA